MASNTRTAWKLPALMVAILLGLAAQGAQAAPRHGVWDRVEDRIDRRENRIDRQQVLGPRDLIEDRIDRREDRRDRAGLHVPRRLDRHERRSWRRIWADH